MNNSLIWQQDSIDPDNGDNLNAIAQWWSNLAGKEIAWQQRILPTGDDLEGIDWQDQKFDERLVLQTPQLRGITIFWRNEIDGEERNITPRKLQLDRSRQQLLVFPQSQSQVVIRIDLPGVVYQKLNLVNPEIAATVKDKSGILLLRDAEQKLEVKITLDSDKLNLLLDRLKTIEN